jgi:hypothetical protein
MSIINSPTQGASIKPKRFDIEIYQGDDFEFNVVLKDNTGTPLNLTGWTGIAQIKKSSDNGTAEAPQFDIEVGTTDGRVTASIAGEDTALLQPQVPYKYDLQLSDTEGKRRTFLAGTILVTEEVSE